MIIYGIIYKITNNVNKKIYIGQTIQSLAKRKAVHKNKSKNGNYYIQRAIRKYGWDNFSWETIHEGSNKKELNTKEIEYINIYESNNPSKGYNMTKGGDYNPMSNPLIRERARKNIKKAMKKFTGKNNVMNRPEVKKYHLQKIQEITKTDEWKEAKIKGDEKQKSTYEITTPNKEKFIITGLNIFCKENNLSQSKMSSVVSGKRTHHKGYICKRLSIGKPIGYNKSSNKYKITTPYNKILIIDNLTKYCEENNLAYVSMLAVVKGRQNQHKGYICESWED